MLSYPYGWILAGGFFVAVAGIVILASPVVINGHLKRVGQNDDAEFTIKALYGLFNYRIAVPVISFTGKSVQLKEQVSSTGAGLNSWKQFNDEIDAERVVHSIERFKQILQLTRDLTGWAKKSLAKVNLEQWNWSTTVGTGDAMWTAMATGAVWSIKTSIVGILSQFVKLTGQPSMQVNPNFGRAAFTMEWSCIAQIRFGYAILAGLQLLVRMKKWKGGVKSWQNILFKA